MQQRAFQKRSRDHTFASERRRPETRRTRKNKNMNLIRNYRNWRRYRETVNELSRLSNRELSDLGIARGDIAFVARKSV